MRFRIFDFVIIGIIAFLIGWNMYSVFRFSQFVNASEIERARTSDYATAAQLTSSFISLNAAIENLSRRTADNINEVSQKAQQDYADYAKEFEKIYAILNQQKQLLLELRAKIGKKGP